jgi:queuine/archaeosine tRNA-ribosyltransferase
MSWNITKWKNLPRELFIDSGAYSSRRERISDCSEVLDRQLFISREWPVSRNLYFSHPDILIPIRSNFETYNRIVSSSLHRAKVYMDLISKSKTHAEPVGVIHAFDEETLINSYYDLKEVGYRYFALGSIAQRLSTNKSSCLNAIDTAVKHRVKPLHLFGVTFSTNLLNYVENIESFDSSASAKLGFYGTVLYGSPLQRYVIAPDSAQKHHDRCFKFRRTLREPLPCKCPVCKSGTENLTSKIGRKAKQNRTIHNYFQIKWETQKKTFPGTGH